MEQNIGYLEMLTASSVMQLCPTDAYEASFSTSTDPASYSKQLSMATYTFFERFICLLLMLVLK